MPKVVLILNDIRSTHNVGSILRTAEVFGLNKVYFSGITPYPKLSNDQRLPHIADKLDRQIHKTALGAEKMLKLEFHSNYQELINILKSDDYTIASLEQSPNSRNISGYSTKNNIALIVGNEVEGVNDWTIKNSDVILEIEQFGKKESLNVSSATAIALYELRKQLS